jgi:hypothetical protein
MKENMNYINALPDFWRCKEFCLLVQGLNEELAHFPEFKISVKILNM